MNRHDRRTATAEPTPTSRSATAPRWRPPSRSPNRLFDRFDAGELDRQTYDAQLKRILCTHQVVDGIPRRLSDGHHGRPRGWAT
jgi:hypothetical protein